MTLTKSFYILFSFSILLLSSCVSKKKVLRFQDIESINENADNISYNTTIRSNDLLSITVTALSPKSVEPFNPIANSPSPRTGNDELRTYLVDESGNIQFPLIGDIKVGDLTRKEVIKLLEEKISFYVKNPIVNLRIRNFTVSVLGEVRNPGRFVIEDERISILEALSLAGDMTIFGERSSVKIIRELNGKKEYGDLDFTSINIVNSPYYYLQQNDVVFVSPNKAQVQSSAFNRNSGIFISIAGIIITVISIFLR